MKWLDRIPLPGLLLVAVVLGLAPFSPEPHLLQKTRLLVAGELTRPIDILDLALHGGPLLLLIARLIRLGFRKWGDTSDQTGS